jgi:uncharacterized protein YbcV (DUF1398 family)
MSTHQAGQTSFSGYTYTAAPAGLPQLSYIKFFTVMEKQEEV